MKTIIAFAFLFSFTASATDLYSTQRFSDIHGIISEEIVNGFPEDGFGGSFETCYTGKVEVVCSLIKRAARGSYDGYGQGLHGYFEVRSCVVNGKTVELSYEQITDYGNSDVKKTITVCAE